ncbi:MAG: hypothetical protein MI863_07295 [Desulfobacterales bacterium]|nr:hypothetical protein [Desulfobacterales bacterium]
MDLMVNSPGVNPPSLIGRSRVRVKEKIMHKSIEVLVKHFRDIVEKIPRSEFRGHSSLSAADFPDGCCDDSSHLLAEYLFEELGVIVDLIHGSNGGEKNEILSHDWLYYDSIIIDITSDQFNWKGYKNPAIYFGKEDEFHSSFTQTRRQDARWSSLDDQGGLGFAYSIVKKNL